MTGLEQFFFEFFFENCALPQIFLSRSMQRRDSLGATTKISRLSTWTTRKFKTRRSRSTISSISDLIADEATTKGQAGISVSGMKLRSDKNLNGIKVEPREELLFRGMSKSKTKGNKWRKITIISSQAEQECDDVKYKPEGGTNKLESQENLEFFV